MRLSSVCGLLGDWAKQLLFDLYVQLHFAHYLKKQANKYLHYDPMIFPVSHPPPMIYDYFIACSPGWGALIEEKVQYRCCVAVSAVWSHTWHNNLLLCEAHSMKRAIYSCSTETRKYVIYTLNVYTGQKTRQHVVLKKPAKCVQYVRSLKEICLLFYIRQLLSNGWYSFGGMFFHLSNH
jgi:hypothetical protein